MSVGHEVVGVPRLVGRALAAAVGRRPVGCQPRDRPILRHQAQPQGRSAPGLFSDLLSSHSAHEGGAPPRVNRTCAFVTLRGVMYCTKERTERCAKKKRRRRSGRGVRRGGRSLRDRAVGRASGSFMASVVRWVSTRGSGHGGPKLGQEVAVEEKALARSAWIRWLT